jgi:hypothetical protein
MYSGDLLCRLCTYRIRITSFTSLQLNCDCGQLHTLIIYLIAEQCSSFTKHHKFEPKYNRDLFAKVAFTVAGRLLDSNNNIEVKFSCQRHLIVFCNHSRD